jgi:hypothetical protein
VADVQGEARVRTTPVEAAIQTASGRRFSLLEPRASDVDIGDVAHALSNQCRFGGHSRVFYSVAQHSCVVADAVEAAGADATTTLWALLHDASEAYLLDLPHPIKHRTALGEAYREVEAGVTAAIAEHFALPVAPPPIVKRIDREVLAAERLAFMQVEWDWPELDGVTPLELELEPWSPERAASEFLARFERLESAR